MVRAFPAVVRFTGVSFSYNIAYAVLGGITPIVVARLAHLNPFGPAHFITGVAAVGLLGILLAPTRGDLTADSCTRRIERIHSGVKVICP